MLIELLISSAYVPIAQINQASGKIRNYQMAIAIIFLATFVLTYVLYKMKMPVYSTFVLSVVLAVVGLFVRVLILRRDNDFPARTYLVKIMLPLLPVSALSLVVPISIYNLVETSFLTFIANSVVGFLTSILLIWMLGLDKTEKGFVTEKVLSKIKKNK